MRRALAISSGVQSGAGAIATRHGIPQVQGATATRI